MDAREHNRPFSYSGDDHGGNPHDMLEEARDGLWAAVHMVEACEVLEPTPMALKGLGNILRGLTATLESAQEIIEERLSDGSAAGCAPGASLRGTGPARQLPERLKEGRSLDGAAEDECETDRLVAAFHNGAAMAREYPSTPVLDLWDLHDQLVRQGRGHEAWERWAGYGPRPDGEPEHVAAE